MVRVGAYKIVAALGMLSLLVVSPASGRAGTRPEPQHRLALSSVTVYWTNAPVRPRRAVIEAGATFTVDIARAEPGKGCASKWAPLPGGGFACLDRTRVVRQRPAKVPRLVDGLLPFVYAHLKGKKAFNYAFLPVGAARSGNKLERSGRPFDSRRYELHQPSRFQGWNLERQPIRQPRFTPGWTAAEVGLFDTPSAEGRRLKRLARHTRLLVERGPATARWHRVRDDRSARVLGYVQRGDQVRHWVDGADRSGATNDETWIDIDVGQQLLALRQGSDRLLFVTLISGGLPERPTPLGSFRIHHKYAYKSMGNLPTSADKYFVENVPWVLYFSRYYAIHGAYWHEEFGKQRSHGCVNLSPRDAAFLYDRVGPAGDRGFFTTFASDRAPGTLVRVRDSAAREAEPKVALE